MNPLHPYAARVLDELAGRLPWEHSFAGAAREVFGSISPVLEQNPRYQAAAVLERLLEPERVVAFRVVWTDDRGRPRVNRGFRVQHSSVLGPYKGGLRFHASVSLDSLKFLAFEQTFKNALTGLPLGGAKGGADLSARGLSENESMHFCQAFMTELHRHIGAETDVPAGDIGVGTREIGYLFGQYKRLTNAFNGTLTGKAIAWGGSRLRPEATGYGLAYFVEHMLAARGDGFAGKRVAVSGFGNVAWGTVKKVTELGGKVVTLSGPDGFVYDPEGIRDDRIEYMRQMRSSNQDEVRAYAQKFGVEFYAGKRPWVVPCDVALPCAIQDELDSDDARALAASGCRLVVEGANMPVTAAAIDVLREAGIGFAPGKAANAGGVAVSGFEMMQNRQLASWDQDRVDAALRRTMSHIHDACLESAAQYGRPGDYLAGANIAGFTRVAEALLDEGVV